MLSATWPGELMSEETSYRVLQLESEQLHYRTYFLYCKLSDKRIFLYYGGVSNGKK